MSRPSRFWSVVALFAALNAVGWYWVRHELTAGGKPRLRILSALPARDIDRADRLTLVFDEGVVDRERVGKPLDKSPFTIQPAADGHWQWSDPDRLEFVLAKPLPPGRVFKIKPAVDLESQTRRVLIGTGEYEFRTRQLTIEGCRLQSADREDATIEFAFNQKVSPADLLARLMVSHGESNAKLDASCLTREPAETLIVRVPFEQADHVDVVIDGGLTGVGGELSLGKPFRTQVKMADSFVLLRARVQAPRIEPDVAVTLVFSQPIDAARGAPKVTIEPKIDEPRVRAAYNSVIVEGRFECGKRYTATVGGEILSKEGKALGDDQRVSFDIPDREPTVRFPLSHGILSPQGNLLLDLDVVNIAGLEIEASRVFANNLVPHVRGEGVRETSDTLATKKIKLDNKRNVPKSVALELKSLLDQPVGVYHLRARATDQAWTDDSAIVTVSDLAITSKRTRDGLFAWVTSLRTGKPVEGAEVGALSYANQSLGTAKTGADGTAMIRLPKREADRDVWLVTASLGEDLNFLRPDQRPWVIDDVDQTGRAVPENYDILLYTERGVYRPGDPIHLTGLIRDVNGEVPPAFPITLTMTRPDGKKLPAVTATPTEGAQGFFQIDLPTRKDGQTGKYTVVATLPGSNDVLGQTSALVEAFAPVRIELNAEAGEPRYGPGQKPTATVSGKYLFGPPAAGLPLTVNVTYVATAYRSKAHPEFTFGDRTAKPTQAPKPITTTTNAEGKANVTLPLPKEAKAGRWRAECAATLTEPGGRSVSQSFSTIVDSTDRFLGLRLPGGAIAPVAAALPVEFALVTAEDAPAEAGPVEVLLERIEYSNVLQKVNGRPVWKTNERAIQIVKKTLRDVETKDGVAAFELACPAAGPYRLSAVDKKSKAAAQLSFYASEEVDAAQAVALNKPEHVELVLDAKSYKPGTSATALVRAPFAGTMLVTLEGDRVWSHQIVDLTENSTKVSIDIPKDVRGGAYLTASVIRAIDPTHEKWLPHRAIGMARVVTDHVDHALPLQLTTPPTCTPGETVEAVVQGPASEEGQSPAMVHLWAVDEGILLTTAYQPRNPLGYFLAHRQATIQTADLFADLLPDTARPVSMDRIGSDGDDGGLGMRGNPVPMRQRAPAIVWRAIEPLDREGRLVVRVPIPKMTGAMRIMAVVAAGDRYGLVTAGLTVASPLLCEAAWPRFVAPDDQFKTPIKIFNTTGAAVTADLAFDVTGPLVLDLPKERVAVEVPAGGSATHWVTATSTGMGAVHVKVTASAQTSDQGTLLADAEADFPSRPAAPLHSESTFVTIKAGDTVDLAPPEGYLPGAVNRVVTISANPTVDLRPAVEQLLDYPYGCVEQTTSQLYAMLYAPDLLSAAEPGTQHSGVVAGMIQAGINRLWSMQTRDGGIGYWPGALHADAWGTAYAAGYLAAAAKAGHHVEPAFVEELVRYLDRRLNASGGDDVDENVRAEICHVLAALDRPAKGWMDRLHQRPDKLDMTGRAHLAAAWIAAGRKDRAAEILRDDTIGQSIATTTTGRFVSQAQSEAALLSVLVDLDPRHPWITPLVQRLNKSRTDGRWGTTLEDAAAIAALAKYQLVVDDHGEFTGTLTVGGADHYEFGSAGVAQFTLANADQPAKIEFSGKGDIHVCLTTSGRRVDETAKPYDHRLVARRKWMTRDGRPIDPTKLRVGDLIRVRVVLSAPELKSGIVVNNVAVVDALPGGVEVDNPRLATSSHAQAVAPEDSGESDATDGETPEGDDAADEDAAEDGSTTAVANATATGDSTPAEDANAANDGPLGEADRVEFQDDRVVLFAAVARDKRCYEYYLRVISVGSFAAPALEASCMYDPAFASLSGGGRIAVGE